MSILPDSATPLRTDQQQHVTALYLDHGDRIRQQVVALLRPADQHLADDLAQDVWLTLWQYVLRGNTITRPGGLLCTMARHRVADHYRAAHTRRSAPADFADTFEARRLPAAPSAESEALAVAAVRELVAA